MNYFVTKTMEGLLYEFRAKNGDLIKMHYIGYPKAICRTLFSRYLKEQGVK